MTVAGGVPVSSRQVWDMLWACRNGDNARAMALIAETPALCYAQYNYTPPIHLAVREGNEELVALLLDQGACDPTYRTYPFLDNLLQMAVDRSFEGIAARLEEYNNQPDRQQFFSENGNIDYQRSAGQRELELAVDHGDRSLVASILEKNPLFAMEDSYFWGEGLLMMPAKAADFALVELLLQYNTAIPPTLKWGQYYYFERYDSTAFLLERGIDPDTHSWQNVTLLHDMAQKGQVPKAELFVKHGADINALDDEYRSTPLGIACRWGHIDMVNYLLGQGADPNLSGASWSTPLAWALKKGHSEIERVLLNAGARHH